MPVNKPVTAKRFQPNPDHETVLASAKLAIKGILGLNIVIKQKKALLSRMLWAITEVHGKWKTRYRSEGVKTDRSAKIQHEHVYTRKSLIMQLLNDPERMDSTLEYAIACLVTENEHELLNKVTREQPALNGWQRYQAAGIKVWDMQTIEVFEFPK